MSKVNHKRRVTSDANTACGVFGLSDDKTPVTCLACVDRMIADYTAMKNAGPLGETIAFGDARIRTERANDD